MADSEASWRSALTPQKAPTYGNQAMFITSPKELQLVNVDYAVVFEGTRKHHVVIAEAINPFTLHVIIPEHDTAEEVAVKVFLCQNSNLTIITSLKFTYISQMEHAIAKFLAQSASDPEVAEKLDAIWTICLGKDHQELWDKRLAQAFVQLELPIEWTLVGDILQKDSEAQQTLLHFAANHGLKELINVFLDLPGAKLALSTCDKSGLMPRDVARENGRLDLVELLDTDRFVENKKGSFSKDSNRRRVLRNNDHGATTVTNSRNHSVKDDINLLLELNKLVKVKKNGSPINRHSWPVKASSFSLENYIEDLRNAVTKADGTGNLDNSKPLFLGESLDHLRNITEELCQLRLQNSQKTSNEISVIADQNRRLMHSRRLSCPASVSRRKKGLQGIPKTSAKLRDSPTHERHVDTDGDPETNTESSEPIFSTPPHSPTVEHEIELPSTAAITPPLDESLVDHDEIHEPCEFMTPMTNTPTSSPAPPSSPMPVSYKYSPVQRRSPYIRKDRPNTWYGEPAEGAVDDEAMSPRSNSLEDFAKKLAQNEDTDDESLPEGNSKGNLSSTISSVVDKADRSASFVSSLSDLSVGKDSLSDEEKELDEREDVKGGGHEEDEERPGNVEPEEKEEREGLEDHNANEERGEQVIQVADDIQEQEELEENRESEEPLEPEEHLEPEEPLEPEELLEPEESEHEPEQNEDRKLEGNGEYREPEEVNGIEEDLNDKEVVDLEAHVGITDAVSEQKEELSEIDRKNDDDELVNAVQNTHALFDRMGSVEDETEVMQPEIKSLPSSPSENGFETSNSLSSRVDSAGDVENHVDEKTTKSEEEVEDSRRIRFDETVKRSKSPSYIDEPMNDQPMNDEMKGALEHGEFRQRSGLLFVSKTPVKRTGSDISVTSLQDVQLDMHSTSRDEDITPGALNAARKARSHGDLSGFHASINEMTARDESDDEERENELRRVEEDQKQLSVQNRIMKFEKVSTLSCSTDKLEQIGNSRVTDSKEYDEQGKRRWSNFFYAKNPKPSKKASRTPTFRRETLRSSMSNFKPGKSSGKKSIDALVSGQHAAAFAKHSSTAPSLNTSATARPRASSKVDSPGGTRRSTISVEVECEEIKPGTESSEEVPPDDANEALDLDIDSDLENFDREPEAWSVTVDRKVLKKMSTKDIKRQDVILELIQTERHHVRTLKIMQQVFYSGLKKQANYPTKKLDQLFPRIDELIEISSKFHQNLKCRQDEAAAVQKIGDVIVKHFSGENGQRIKEAYGEFVSKHPEVVALYKYCFKTDKKFANYIKKCHGHRVVRRLSIPECCTLVTQRMTKYPLLIEAIMKATKTSNPDYKELQKSLLLVKDVLHAVDNAIKDYEKQSKLKDIKMRMEKGSVVLKNGLKIKNSRFVDYQSKMVYTGLLNWKNARGRLSETHVVLLESMVAFLQESDKKFGLLSIDGKSPCISLKTLMVREVATDKNAIYFVSTSKLGPEMYEFVCSNPKMKKQWVSIISEAIHNAPEETGNLFQSPEEEKRLAEERMNRRDEILGIMKTKDRELSAVIDEKNKLFSEMKEILHTLDGNGKSNDDERVSSTERARNILLAAIHHTTQLTATSILHESHSDSELAAAAHDEKENSPKRAETFGGFDRRPSQKGPRRQPSVIAEGTSESSNVTQRRDSGCSTTSLASELVLNQGQDGGPTSFIQILDALQWVLLKFNQKETDFEQLCAQFQYAENEIQKLRVAKYKNDKQQLVLKEAHQAELTRQKEAYNELERTFNEQVQAQNVKLKLQQEQHQDLLKTFTELRQALTSNYPSGTS